MLATPANIAGIAQSSIVIWTPSKLTCTWLVLIGPRYPREWPLPEEVLLDA